MSEDRVAIREAKRPRVRVSTILDPAAAAACTRPGAPPHPDGAGASGHPNRVAPRHRPHLVLATHTTRQKYDIFSTILARK